MDQNPQGNIISGVGFTALAAAAGRAVETSRPDRLIDQPRVLEFKDGALREEGALPRCVRAVVGIDLRHDWAGH